MVGTSDPATFNERIAAQRMDSVAQNSNARAAAAEAGPATGVSVSVFFHVLRSGFLEAEGNVPDSVVSAQIQVRMLEGTRPLGLNCCSLPLSEEGNLQIVPQCSPVFNVKKNLGSEGAVALAVAGPKQGVC